MNGELLRRTVVVRNPQGMHLRPIAALAKLAGQFQCDIRIGRPGQELVNGKSPLLMMPAVLVEMGTELVVEASGPDAQQALDALAKFFEEWVTEP